MRRYIRFLGGLALLAGIIAGACFAADDDGRFKGGSYDGYDCFTTTNTTIESGIIPSGTIFGVY